MTSRRLTSNIWHHFTKEKGKAKCRYCHTSIAMSIRGSYGNLKRHLKLKHPTVSCNQEDRKNGSRPSSTEPIPNEIVDISLNSQPPVNQVPESSVPSRRLTSDVWYHYTKEKGRGKCRYCHLSISMSRGSYGNLKRHLKLKHPTVSYNREERKNGSRPSSTEPIPNEIVDVTLTSQPPVNQVLESSMPSRRLTSDVWYHFTKEKGRGKCRYCHSSISMSRGSYGNLKRHLKLKHPTVSYNREERKNGSRPSSTEPIPNEIVDVTLNSQPPTQLMLPVNQVPESSSMPTRRLTSDVWFHFTKEKGGKGKCHYCHSSISMSRGSYGNLKRHLRLKHPTVSYNREERKNGSRPSSTKALEARPGTSTSDSLDKTANLASATPSLPTALQPLLRKFVKVTNPNNQNRLIDIQLLKMICKEYNPFSIVEDEEFKKFVRLLCPSYSLPSQMSLSNLLSSLHSDLIQKVKSELLNAKAICLTSDSWTNISNTSFYTLTAHYIDQDTQSKSFLLDCSAFEAEHTSENISKWVETVTQRFYAENKISAIVTDNAAKMKAAASNLKFLHISCFAHSLNLVVQNAILKSVQNTVNKVRDTVQFFKESSHSLSKLHEMQGNLKKDHVKLKLDVPNRWHSTFDMLEQFHLNKVLILSTLVLLGNSSKLVFLDEDWETISHCVNLLQVFNDAMIDISAEKIVTLSKANVLSRMMANWVKSYLKENKTIGEDSQKLGRELLNGLTEQFGESESNELISQAILLDPRFKKQGFSDDSTFNSTYRHLVRRMRADIAMSRQYLQFQTEQLTGPSSRPLAQNDSIWDEFDEAVSRPQVIHDPSSAAIVELDKYLAELHLFRSNDPLVWWESRKNMYPTLYQIVLKRLSIPATSVPCERIFSKAGEISTEKQKRLSSKKLSLILFFNHNCTLLE